MYTVVVRVDIEVVRDIVKVSVEFCAGLGVVVHTVVVEVREAVIALVNCTVSVGIEITVSTLLDVVDTVVIGVYILVVRCTVTVRVSDRCRFRGIVHTVLVFILKVLIVPVNYAVVISVEGTVSTFLDIVDTVVVRVNVDVVRVVIRVSLSYWCSF